MSTKHCEQTDANHAPHFWGKGRWRCNGHETLPTRVAESPDRPLADPAADTVGGTHELQIRLGDEDGETLLLISQSLHRIAESLEVLTDIVGEYARREGLK
jgi:hypothetical protein